MRHTLLMFDVDLTLVNADGAGQRAMLTAGAQVCGEGFSFEGISFGGRLDPLIFADAVANSGLAADAAGKMHDDFRAAYTKAFRRLINDNGHTVTALPGIATLIDQLRKRVHVQDDVMLGLLTGNYAETASMKIESAGLQRDWFTLGCFGDEADSRPGLTELAMRRYTGLTGTPADPARVVIIGDTTHDVHCAKAHGCTAFAVATGRVNADELRDAGADIVVDDLSDPTPLLDLIRS
jgi:phosphoglycolate phosphatase